MLPDRGRGRHMNLIGWRAKAQNITKDAWAVKDKLKLLDAVQIRGTENWTEVSSMMQEDQDTKETTKGEEVFSAQNCYRQYQWIMDTVGKEIRKRGEDKDLSAAVRQYIVNERLKELSSIADAYRKQCISVYKSLKQSKGENVDDMDESNDEIIQFEDGKGENNTSSEGNSSYINNKKGTDEEEDDIADLMGILPNVVDMDDEIDTSIMDTSEFEITSPSDSASAIKRALATTSSPKVSPQLKSLVRTAIAGTSEEGPRNSLSSPGNSAPTLSMLLEMPPRDPGQPLPEISTVSKAAQHSPQTSPSRRLPLLLEPINRNRVSPLKSPDKNNANDNQSPKSSSPTLKRLLEGKVLESNLQGIKDEEIGQTKILQEVSSVADIVQKAMEVEVKKEQIAAAVADRKSDVATQGGSGLPTSSNSSTKISIVIDSNAQIEATSELTERLNKLMTPEQISGEIKQEVTPSVEQHLSATPTKVVSLSPDLKDLVVTQNIGTVSPSVSPTKLGTRETHAFTTASSSSSEISSIKTSASVGEHVTKETADKQKVPDEVSLLSKDDIKVEIKMEIDTENDSMNEGALSDISTVKENVSGGRTSKLELPTLSTRGKVAEGTALQTKSPVKSSNVDETGQGLTEISKRDEEMPDIAGEMMELDEGDEARKKVLVPAKTYSRKERYENMDTEDDSSSSTFESSAKAKSPSRVGSPGRSVKKPYDSTTKTETPSSERRGRKPLLSESRTTEKGIDTSQEEDGRVTRARAKPSPVPSPSRTPSGGGSPVKGRPHTPESDSGSRTTRSRTTSVTSTTSAGTVPALEPAAKDLVVDSVNKLPATPAGRKAQSTEENLSSTSTGDVETTNVTPATGGTGRGRGGRPSSQRVLDSLPSARQVLESNPSSPSSTTTSSTNMDDDKEHKNFRRNINIVLEQIKSHKYAGIFLKPITAPSYLEAVKRPMDLSTIKKNLDSGQIRSVAAFERDVLLMFVNAIMFNSESTETYKMTKAMEADVRSMIVNYKMTHGLLSQRILEEQERLRDSDSTPIIPKPGRGRGRGRGGRGGGRGRGGRKSQNNTSSHEMESPIGDHSTAAESGESESEMDVEVDKGRRREKESSPDIVDGHGDSGTKTRRSRSSSPVASISQDDC